MNESYMFLQIIASSYRNNWSGESDAILNHT